MDTTPHTTAELALYSAAEPAMILHWLSNDVWVPYDPAIVHRMRLALSVMNDRAGFRMFFHVQPLNGQPRVTYMISFPDAAQVRTSSCDANCPPAHLTGQSSAIHSRALKFITPSAELAQEHAAFHAATESIALAPKGEDTSLTHMERVMWKSKCDALIELAEELGTQPQCESCSCDFTAVPTVPGPDHSPYSIRGCFHTHCHDCVVGWMAGLTPLCGVCRARFTNGDVLLNDRLIDYIDDRGEDDSDGFEVLEGEAN